MKIKIDISNEELEEIIDNRLESFGNDTHDRHVTSDIINQYRDEIIEEIEYTLDSEVDSMLVVETIESFLVDKNLIDYTKEE